MVRQYFVEQVGVFKLCALLSTTPTEMCLKVVLMLYRVVWFQYGPGMFRILVSYSSRRVQDVLRRTFLTFLLVELRYLVGRFWREIKLNF